MQNQLDKLSLTIPLRRANEASRGIIKAFEGLRLTPYLCPAKIWTIGYGHTRTVYAGMQITKQEAEALLDEDLRMFERAVQRLVTVALNDNQFSALVSFAFNVGVTSLENSTLLRLLNRGWYEQVPVQMMRWNKVNGEVLGGLSRRRVAEAKLWRSTLGLGAYQ